MGRPSALESVKLGEDGCPVTWVVLSELLVSEPQCLPLQNRTAGARAGGF